MRAVILSGGPTHDFAATTACLRELLSDAATDVEEFDGQEGVDAAFRALPGANLLVINALRWTMNGPDCPDRYRVRADLESASPGPAARQALTAHLAAGGGLLAMHTATICFDDWPEWGDTLGAAWKWGTSSHPPIGPVVTVRVTGRHPLVADVDDFAIVDEIYSDQVLRPGIEPLLTASPPGTTREPQPLLWAREHGGGRVVYDALGHSPESYQVPEHREIVLRAIRWTASGGTGRS